MDRGDLTAQEKAILEGKSTWTRTAPGFDRLLERIRGLPIRLLVDRARILTEVYREAEDLPVNLRHAKFLKAFAEQIPVFIHPDEEIVGSPAPWVGPVCGPLFRVRRRGV